MSISTDEDAVPYWTQMRRIWFGRINKGCADSRRSEAGKTERGGRSQVQCDMGVIEEGE